VHSIIKSAFLTIILTPCLAFAMATGDYFQQGLTVENYTTNSILATDQNTPELHDYTIPSYRYLEATYASDKFTDPAGQTFTHTITINSSIDYSVICTVESRLLITSTGITASKPISSNEQKCQTSVYQRFSTNSAVYGFKIAVKA
jgi:hypothetical protein